MSWRALVKPLGLSGSWLSALQQQFAWGACQGTFQLKHSGTMIMFFDAHRWAGISKTRRWSPKSSELRKYCWPRVEEGGCPQWSGPHRSTWRYINISEKQRIRESRLDSFPWSSRRQVTHHPHYQHWTGIPGPHFSKAADWGPTTLSVSSSTFLSVHDCSHYSKFGMWFTCNKPDHLCTKRD